MSKHRVTIYEDYHGKINLDIEERVWFIFPFWELRAGWASYNEHDIQNKLEWLQQKYNVVRVIDKTKKFVLD